MGWSWRRSVSVGPARLNFSRSGVGVSVGVRGARVSSGPRGTYVHLGAGGFRYSQRLDAPVPRPVPEARPAAGPGRRVENVEPARSVESTSDELLSEIRRKQARVSLVGLTLAAAGVGMALYLLCAARDGPVAARWWAIGLSLAALASTPWASWWDRRAKTVRVHYLLDPLGQQVQEGVGRLLEAFARAHAVWSVHREHAHGDWKRNAGAGVSVARSRVAVGWGAPPNVVTNVRVGYLEVDGTRLYFFPDRLLIFGQGGVRGVPYADLRMEAGQVHFREEEGVPRDARVLGSTWRFVNKDGGPDRRFAGNCQIPIVLYGTLGLSSPSGLRVNLQTSSDSLASGSAELLRVIQAAVRDLESRKAIGPRPAELPSFAEDPPPLILPGMSLARSALDALSLKWLARLPGWAAPIAWGLVFSLPLVVLMARVAGRRGLGADLLFCGSFVVAGGGAGGLTFEGLRAGRARREQEAVSRRSRFRAVLMEELKGRPAARFDFAAFVKDCGLPRDEADQVAGEVFRRVADRVFADGVVTVSERRKLNVLAKSLDLRPHHANRLEDEAKAARYQSAVSKAMADRTVTEEEARALNALQINLGIQDERWAAGDVVPPG